MIKHYCDVCEEEVEEENNAIHNRINDISESGVIIEIMVGFKSWNNGCVCPKCFIEAVNDVMNKRFFPTNTALNADTMDKDGTYSFVENTIKNLE